MTTAAVALERSRLQRRGQIYVALAAVAWSSAGVLQRQLTLDTSTQVLGRAVFAGAALLAYVAVVDRGRVLQGGDDAGWLAALGIGQIGLGMALLTVGARLIPAAQVGLITLLEILLGPLWVWLALDERPSTLTLVGGAIVIVAILVQTSGAPPSERDDQRALPAPH